MFSATYPESVKEAISLVVKEAQQINIRKELLQLDHIKQYSFRCDKGKKPEFVKSVFEVCAMTQTIIFVNSKMFAEKLFEILRKASLQVVIIFGSMDNCERDEMIEKFRTGKIAVIITTNMLARGIDVPEVQIVINFDVPLMGAEQDGVQGDAENYLHRIGRTGRFGTKGLALTIYDRDIDETYLNQILDHYNMKDKCKPLSGPEQLIDLLEEIRNV